MKSVESFSALAKATAVMLIFATSAVQADEWTGNVSAYLGYKSVDDKDWPNLDSQRSAGVISDFGKRSWPVSIAADLVFAADDNRSESTEITGGTAELHLGARKAWSLENSSFSPYVGGGLALINASIEQESSGMVTEEDDTAIGAWVGVGTYYAITPRINLGVDVRYSFAEVTLFDQDRETGGLNAGITLGYHW